MKIQKGYRMLAIVALLAPAFAWAEYPAEVARTGQTTCYDTDGNAVDCAGTGQDGDWLAGVPWPDPRFTDNGDGSVIDNLTGLVWAKDANLMATRDPSFDADGTAGDGLVTWQHALDYVAKLNSESYLGYTDWSLPNIYELESLANFEAYAPALPAGHPFVNVQSTYYWSSTSIAYRPNYAWVVNMSYGDASSDYKPNYTYVWPVRSGQCGSLGSSVICLPKTGQTNCFNTAGDSTACSGTGQDGDVRSGIVWPSPRFVDNGDETVTDSLTGLEWVKDANLMATRDPSFDADGTAGDGGVTWQHALDYAAKLNSENYLGHSDWRLPNERELRSLADHSTYNPALPQDYPFTNVQSDLYWSSTSRASHPYRAWLVGSWGDVGGDGKTYDVVYVWPVRSGQCGSFDTSTTTTTVGSTTTTTSVVAATSTTTTASGATTTACPATQALGAENPRLATLRNFRDGTLAQSTLGQKVIQIYYNNADTINAALDRSPALRSTARWVLEAIAPMLGRVEKSE